MPDCVFFLDVCFLGNLKENPHLILEELSNIFLTIGAWK